MDNRKTKQPFSFFLSIFTLILASLPIIFTLLWFHQNTELPSNDAANYLHTMVNFYQATQKNLWHGLSSFYLERGFRPISFPNMAMPFLLFAKGNLFFAYQALSCALLLFSLAYVYLFARLLLDKLPATIASAIIGLLPFVQSQVLLFYAESAFFPCMLGTIYHLIRSDFLRNKKHALLFALLFALALTIRPVEALTHFIFIAIAFIFIGFRMTLFSSKELMAVMLSTIAAALLFFCVAILPYIHIQIVALIDQAGPFDQHMFKTLWHSLLATFFFFCMFMCYLFSKNYKKIMNVFAQQQIKTYLLPSVSLLILLTVIWFLPKAFDTYQWIYRTSMGDVAKSTGSLTGPKFSWSVLSIYLHEEGLLIIGGSLFLCALSVLLDYKSARKLIFSPMILFLILLMPFTFWEAFYTVQVVTRKLSLAFPALLLALLMIGLTPGKFYRVRIGIACGLLLAQFALLMTFFMPTIKHPVPFIHHTIGYFIQFPKTIRPNPHDETLNFLAKAEQQKPFASVALMLNPGTPDARHFVSALPIDPFLFGTMVQASKQPYYANYVYFSDYTRENFHRLQAQYDVVLLSDQAEIMQISEPSAQAYQQKYLQEKNPNLKMFYEFLIHYANQTLADLGFVLDHCMMLKTQNNGDYRACLLRRQE